MGRIKDCSIAHSQGTADSAVRDLVVLPMGYQYESGRTCLFKMKNKLASQNSATLFFGLALLLLLGTQMC